MAQNRERVVTARADWRSQTNVKNYCNFKSVEMRFFSVVEIPIKHSSLCIELNFYKFGNTLMSLHYARRW